MEWPPNWEDLREEMTARIKGEGRPPNTPPDSATIQLPVFADPQDRGSEARVDDLRPQRGLLTEQGAAAPGDGVFESRVARRSMTCR